MNNPRQYLLNAIADRRYHQIASYLDDHIAHSDLTKDLFMEKLEEMFEMIKADEDENEIFTIELGMNLMEYAKVHNYCDPVFFRVKESFFIFDIYETIPGKYCMDECEALFEDTEMRCHYKLGIYDDERVSFTPDENYLNTMSFLNDFFHEDDGSFKTYFWTVDTLRKWVEEHKSIFKNNESDHNYYKGILPYTHFYNKISEIANAYMRYDHVLAGIAAYGKVDFQNSEQNYHWSREYGHDFLSLRSLYFEVEEDYEGYFTISPSVPYHYLPYKGYEQLVSFLNLNRVVYCYSLEHRSKLFQESLDEDFDDESE